jgi:hypothetical protein
MAATQLSKREGWCTIRATNSKLISTSRESTNRALSALIHQGLIDV